MHESQTSPVRKLVPGLLLLDQIKEPTLVSRAVCIIEFCKKKLDFIMTQGLFRFYNNHGISHSEKILSFMDDILRAASLRRKKFSDYEIFLLYTSAYCHDLGMLKWSGENFDDPDTCNKVRKIHCKRVADYINRNWREMGIVCEIEAMLIANICQAHRGDKNLGMLQKRLRVDIGGHSDNVITVSVREQLLGAILRLADALDADESRLPYDSIQEHEYIPFAQRTEYYKHELVHHVRICPDEGLIKVQLKIKYEQPIDQKTGKRSDIEHHVRTALKEELEIVRDILKPTIEFKIQFKKMSGACLKPRPPFAPTRKEVKRVESTRWIFFKRSQAKSGSKRYTSN